MKKREDSGAYCHAKRWEWKEEERRVEVLKNKCTIQNYRLQTPSHLIDVDHLPLL